MKQTTEYADAMSIADERESLRLELRDPHGVVVQAEDIWIQDTHRLLALAEAADPVEEEELSEELRAAIEHAIASPPSKSSSTHSADAAACRSIRSGAATRPTLPAMRIPEASTERVTRSNARSPSPTIRTGGRSKPC